MCKKARVCPLYDENNKNGVNGSCKNCEYLKRERKQTILLRLLLGISYAIFLTSTYIVFA